MKKVATKKTKKVTIDDLATMMTSGFKGVSKKLDAVDKKIDKEIDDLAIMVARGFESVHSEMDKRFDKVEERFNKVEKDIEEVKENLASTRMDVLSMGDKFVSKHEFNQHLIRFELLEQKVKTRK